MATDNPKNVTIRGRLSFPRFTHKEAVAANKKSNFVEADEANVKPEFNLLIEQAQLDKLKNHIRDVFIPYVQEQYSKDPKNKDALPPKVVKQILDKLDDEDWDGVPNLLIKSLSDKNRESAPECVASVKLVGSKGADITLKARVEGENQLAVPDPDILTYPALVPLSQSVFTPYAGAFFAATINLYAYFQSANANGIAGGANVAVYLGNLEGERFGGGTDVDEDDIFLDD